MKLIKENKMLKNTKTRQKVKEILNTSSTPLTPAEIFEILKDDGITLSSIYRTLETFAKEDIVIKASDQRGTAIYTINNDHHCHYLECKNCHKKIKLDYCPYHNINNQLSKKFNFDIDENNVVIYGLCECCCKKPNICQIHKHHHK